MIGETERKHRAGGGGSPPWALSKGKEFVFAVSAIGRRRRGARRREGKASGMEKTRRCRDEEAESPSTEPIKPTRWIRKRSNFSSSHVVATSGFSLRKGDRTASREQLSSR